MCPVHANPYPPPREPPGLAERAASLRKAIDVLWPPVLAIVGLGMIITFAVVPSLRNPALIAAFSGMFTVVSASGLARREPR